MPRAMKKALHATANDTRFVPFPGKQPLNGLVNIAAINTGTKFLKRDFLSLSNDRIELLHSFAGSTAHHRARNVATISRAGIAGKDVEDDRAVRPQGPVSGLVRVAPLVAAGDNRARCDPAQSGDGSVDHALHILGFQLLLPPIQKSIPANA